MTKRVTIDLPDDLVSFAEAKVAAGEYVSLDAAVAAGVQGLQQEDQQVDGWVREEVVPSFHQWVADGKPTRSSDEVFADLEARIRAQAAFKAAQ